MSSFMIEKALYTALAPQTYCYITQKTSVGREVAGTANVIRTSGLGYKSAITQLHSYHNKGLSDTVAMK